MNLQNAKLGMVIVDLQNDFLAPDGAYARGNTLSAEAVKLPERMAPVARAIKAHGGLVTASLFTLWPAPSKAGAKGVAVWSRPACSRFGPMRRVSP